MFRAVPLSLKFVNSQKRQKLKDFLDKYNLAVQFFLDELWGETRHKFLAQDVLKKCPIELSARAKQAAGKHAIAIINGALRKYSQRVYRRDLLIKEGKDASRLDALTKNMPNKPDTGYVEARLDSRFIKMTGTQNSFDLWIRLLNINIPLKKTKIFNKWASRGLLQVACHLHENDVVLFFECDAPQNTQVSQIGIDIGIKSVVSTSTGIKNRCCLHGHSLKSILDKLARKKKGSKAFKRAVTHRQNFINWSVNQLKIQDVSIVVVENFKGMRHGKSQKRFLSHFAYSIIFNKLERLCEEWNVSIVKVNPAYTSQKCSFCGEIKAKNRSGERFKCIRCGVALDADINAARNILTSV